MSSGAGKIQTQEPQCCNSWILRTWSDLCCRVNLDCTLKAPVQKAGPQSAVTERWWEPLIHHRVLTFDGDCGILVFSPLVFTSCPWGEPFCPITHTHPQFVCFCFTMDPKGAGARDHGPKYLRQWAKIHLLSLALNCLDICHSDPKWSHSSPAHPFPHGHSPSPACPLYSLALRVLASVSPVASGLLRYHLSLRPWHHYPTSISLTASLLLGYPLSCHGRSDAKKITRGITGKMNPPLLIQETLQKDNGAHVNYPGMKKF